MHTNRVSLCGVSTRRDTLESEISWVRPFRKPQQLGATFGAQAITICVLKKKSAERTNAPVQCTKCK